MKMPETIFCFDLAYIIIDRNYKLTENYLNELTGNLTIERIFENITYLNSENKWISLNSSFRNSEIKIEKFYFLEYKCFKIKKETEYGRDQFYLLDGTRILNVNFKYNDKLTTYFLTKINCKLDFSKIDILKFEKFYKIKNTYISNQEITVLAKNDQFIYIKRPSLLFNEDNDQNDVNNYFANLMYNFELNYNLRTLYLPSEKVNSNNEIDDELFEQYFNQETKQKSSLNSNIQKLFISNDNQFDLSNISKPDFVLELNFIKNEIQVTNEDNFTKLILNLLNILSLWFDLCILDLHVYVYYAYFKMAIILCFIYKLLIRMKIVLSCKLHVS